MQTNTTFIYYISQDKELKDLTLVVKKPFHKEDGPFVKALDVALHSFNVHRQAYYYSGTFVGNHVHTALKVSNQFFDTKLMIKTVGSQ